MILQKCNSNEVNKLIMVTMTSLRKTINHFGNQRNHKIVKKHNNNLCVLSTDAYIISSFSHSLEIISDKRNCILSNIEYSLNIPIPPNRL